jgi:hypothetical protein
MKGSRRISVHSVAALVVTTLILSATGVAAQPPDTPAGLRPGGAP